MRPLADPSAASVAISAARSQIGVPYHWAWEKPGVGFDCSGLTQWAWAQAGVKLPRTTITQVTMGQKVTKAQLQPGDLVFPEAPIHHVQIYTGNGMIIESPETGKNVREVPMWGFFTARRLVAGTVANDAQGFKLPSIPVDAAGVAASLIPGLPNFNDLFAHARGFMIRIVEGLVGVALIIVAVQAIGGEKVMKSQTFRSLAKAVK